MTQILDIISGRKDKKAEPETPQALDRLSAMLTAGTPAEEAPGADTEPACEPAPDDFVASQPNESDFQADDSASQADESVLQADESAPQADGSVFQADESASQADDGEGVSSLFLPNATEAADTDTADDGGGDAMETVAAVSEAKAEVADTVTSHDGGGDPMQTLAAVSAIEDAVREAQQRAESQLTALVERVRKAESEHTAELARVTEAGDQRVEQALNEARAVAKTEVDSLRDELGRHHAGELDEVRKLAQREAVAAVEAALTERNRDYAAEVARVQEDLGRQQTDSLQRVGTAVLDSLERLTERIVTIP